MMQVKYLGELVGWIPSMEAPEPKGISVLLPLCGQSMDLEYLAVRGFTVYGVEAIGEAVDAVLQRFGTETRAEGQVMGRTSWSMRGTPLVMRKAVSDRKLYIVEDGKGEEVQAELRILHGDFMLVTTGKTPIEHRAPHGLPLAATILAVDELSASAKPAHHLNAIATNEEHLSPEHS